jgi:hypothetical protein
LLAGIVREAELDGEGPNDDAATAQPIPLVEPGIQPRVTTVVGSLAVDDEDWYQFPVNAGSGLALKLGVYDVLNCHALLSVYDEQFNLVHAFELEGQLGKFGEFATPLLPLATASEQMRVAYVRVQNLNEWQASPVDYVLQGAYDASFSNVDANDTQNATVLHKNDRYVEAASSYRRYSIPVTAGEDLDLRFSRLLRPANLAGDPSYVVIELHDAQDNLVGSLKLAGDVPTGSLHIPVARSEIWSLTAFPSRPSRDHPDISRAIAYTVFWNASDVASVPLQVIGSHFMRSGDKVGVAVEFEAPVDPRGVNSIAVRVNDVASYEFIPIAPNQILYAFFRPTGDSETVHLQIMPGAAQSQDGRGVLATDQSLSRFDMGDIHADGLLDASDLDRYAALQRDSSPTADLNGDGRFDEQDWSFLVEQVLNTYFGDANLDGQFDSADVVQVFQRGKYEANEPGAQVGWADGDWNGDGRFNSADLVAALAQGGYEAGPRSALAVDRRLLAAALDDDKLRFTTESTEFTGS